MTQTPTAGPADIAALLNLGRRHENENDHAQAVALYRKWLRVFPNAELAHLVWYEFGRLLHRQGENVKAENAFRAALEQKPAYHEATLALGIALETQGRHEDAVAAWQGALPPDALQIQLLNNVARVQDKLHRAEHAEQALITSLRLDPTQDAVLTTLLQQRQKLCRWPVMTPDLGVAVDAQQASIGPLMSLALMDDPVANLRSARHFLAGSTLYAPLPPLVARGAFYPHHARLRVGFLSADFRLHATSVFFAPLIAGLDRHRFEVYALDLTTAADPFVQSREQIIASADHHVPLQQLTDEQAARRIRELEIDILVDLAGLTSGARPSIVGSRPAPLQVSYIGFLASCGIDAVDYIVTTADLFPRGAKAGFSERPLVLPGVYVTLSEDRAPTVALTRADCGLPPEAMVYCALLNSYKITPETYACWMNVLKAVPDSVLWLVEENPTTRGNLERAAATHGVDRQRLHFSPRVHPAQYSAQLALADLFLDTTPYGNGATAREAILAGLPMLTRPGKTMMSRFTAHFIRNLGLKGLIARNLAHYEEIAIRLGQSRALLQKHRATLQAARATSPLFDVPRFVKEFGDALLAVVDRVNSER